MDIEPCPVVATRESKLIVIPISTQVGVTCGILIVSDRAAVPLDLGGCKPLSSTRLSVAADCLNESVGV